MKTAAALDLMVSLLTQAVRVSAMLQAARAEGRDSLTEAEVDELAQENAQARDELVAAIARARAEGR